MVRREQRVHSILRGGRRADTSICGVGGQIVVSDMADVDANPDLYDDCDIVTGPLAAPPAVPSTRQSRKRYAAGISGAALRGAVSPRERLFSR